MMTFIVSRFWKHGDSIQIKVSSGEYNRHIVIFIWKANQVHIAINFTQPSLKFLLPSLSLLPLHFYNQVRGGGQQTI